MPMRADSEFTMRPSSRRMTTGRSDALGDITNILGNTSNQQLAGKQPLAGKPGDRKSLASRTTGTMLGKPLRRKPTTALKENCNEVAAVTYEKADSSTGSGTAGHYAAPEHVILEVAPSAAELVKEETHIDVASALRDHGEVGLLSEMIDGERAVKQVQESAHLVLPAAARIETANSQPLAEPWVNEHLLIPATARIDTANPQSVAEYVDQIYCQLYQEEISCLPRADYMDTQHEINGKMRAILVDWLVEVHMKYKLRTETLFLALSIIDRYLSISQVPRRRLQLVGVVGMLIAAKFEEINPPEVREFVYITDNAYTKDEILIMECTMLTALAFYVATPTTVHFLQRLQRVNGSTEAQREYSQYIAELALLDTLLLRHASSKIAAAAVYLSNEVFGRVPLWSANMAQLARYSDAALSDCAGDLRILLHNAAGMETQAVRRKFMLPQHQAVARMGCQAS